MAKTRNILKHVRTVKSIRTVTRAMQTVASVRFRAAHERVASFGPFAAHVGIAVEDLLRRAEPREMDHPLLTAPEGLKHDVLLVLTSDRGLCGSYNQAVLQLALHRLGQLTSAGYEVDVQVVGARGVRYLEFRGVGIDRVHTGLGDLPEYEVVGALADEAMAALLDGRISGLEVAYMQFATSGLQRPAIAQILPIAELPGDEGGAEEAGADEALAELAPYDFYPSRREILARLLPETVRLQLYQCFLDAGAAEQFMRRAAMQAATDNAEDMIRHLRILCNRARQMQITTELAEIMGGRLEP